MDEWERRKRMYGIAEADPEYVDRVKALRQAHVRLRRMIRFFPGKLRDAVLECSGMEYLVHQRIMDLVCSSMRLCEELSGEDIPINTG